MSKAVINDRWEKVAELTLDGQPDGWSAIIYNIIEYIVAPGDDAQYKARLYSARSVFSAGFCQVTEYLLPLLNKAEEFDDTPEVLGEQRINVCRSHDPNSRIAAPAKERLSISLYRHT